MTAMDGDKEDVLVRPGFIIPAGELHFSFVRSSGPGGQKVNKTSTKVRLKWWPLQSPSVRKALSLADQERLFKKALKQTAEDGSIQLVSERFRTRESNRQECARKLADQIRKWLTKPKKRVPTKPTRTSKEKRIQEKKRIARIKKDRKPPEM